MMGYNLDALRDNMFNVIITLSMLSLNASLSYIPSFIAEQLTIHYFILLTF